MILSKLPLYRCMIRTASFCNIVDVSHTVLLATCGGEKQFAYLIKDIKGVPAENVCKCRSSNEESASYI